MKILVTDGNNRVALAVVRSLGRAGCEVHLVEQERFARRIPIVALSRYVRRFEIVPSLEREEAFVAALARIAGEVDGILPVSTNVVLTLARHRERFHSLRKPLPIPDLATLRIANNKASLMEVAQEEGVPVPVTYDIEGEVRFPAVIKLCDDEGLYLEPGSRYRIVENRAELDAAFTTLRAVKEAPLVQEYVDGDGYGFSAVCDAGEAIAFFCHRRIREYPVDGGPSTLCVSIRDDRLEEYGRRLLRRLQWRGPAMVEFKRESRTGEYKLLEINPRFAGSLPLADHAGVNLPMALAERFFAGHPSIRPPAYMVGRKMRFLLLDCASVASSLFHGEKRWKYLGGFVRDLLDMEVKDGILSMNDIRPGVAYLQQKLSVYG